MILSLMLLNLAGGDCISDIERLEQYAGPKTLLMRFAAHGMKRKQRRAFEKRWRKEKSRGLPSNAAIHRYLPRFHSDEEEKSCDLLQLIRTKITMVGRGIGACAVNTS